MTVDLVSVQPVQLEHNQGHCATLDLCLRELVLSVLVTGRRTVCVPNWHTTYMVCEVAFVSVQLVSIQLSHKILPLSNLGNWKLESVCPSPETFPT